ncbi:hypothetical protein LR48_Vigan07g185900 [Vigna angularis]|uniref:Uncharacterized protein n=1 Tax=Phaseolus angularis TaxID=3914 RepID=A0A0L9UZ66_PHAAN|nr:hypothetical protein LR48_Vigan07g185900 [Vigna angularis]
MAIKFIKLDFYRFYGFQFLDLFGAQGITHLVDINRLLAFQSFLRHLQQQINRRQLLVGGFKVEERLIHYLIVWLLCPRATNHTQCFEHDLLLYGILNNIHIDWHALISDTMLKAKMYHAYHLPYALLISRILEYKGVHIEGELTQDDDHQDDEDDDMDAHMAEPVGVVAPSEAGPFTMPSSSSLSMDEYFSNLSKQLEDMSLAHQARFDELIEMQQTHEEYVIERFDDFDTRLGNIENRLNLHPLETPPSQDF